jgi:hypothetical protein
MVNESRRIAFEHEEEFATQTSWIAELLDQGFFATQFFALRKLMEPGASNPRRQVISLQRLVDDIEAHAHLFTRENFVAHDALPYDPSAAEEHSGGRRRRRASGRATTSVPQTSAALNGPTSVSTACVNKGAIR